MPGKGLREMTEKGTGARGHPSYCQSIPKSAMTVPGSQMGKTWEELTSQLKLFLW